MIEKFLSLFERLVVALENQSAGEGDPTQAAPKRGRGRPAKGEAPAETATTPVSAPSSTTSASVVTTPAPAAEAPSTPATELAAIAVQPTLQKVADAIIDLANNVSRDKAVAILTKYGVKKVPELKPENFAAVLKDVEAAKAPAAESLV